MATCYACQAEISWNATRCPHCTSILDGMGGRSPANPTNGFFDFLGILLVADLAGLYFWPEFTGKINHWLYSLVEGAIQIVSWVYSKITAILGWIS